MTINELYKQGAEMLDYAFVDNAYFDARWLIEAACGMEPKQFALKKDKPASKADEVKFLSLIRRRIAGEPLQYILGEWEFMGYPFAVGQGVLIPRPETEMLVDFAKTVLTGKDAPVVFDLGAGTGCIAISVAKLFPKAKVYAVEKYYDACVYLEMNIKRNKAKNVKLVQGDMTSDQLLRDVTPDLILSNPPYVKSSEMFSLQKEVQREPETALCGGADGLDFYRTLSQQWLPRLRTGGVMAVECGESQSEDVSQMLALMGSDVNIMKDFSGIPRVVTAVKR